MTLDDIFNYFRNYDNKCYAVFAQQGAEPAQIPTPSLLPTPP